MSNNPFKKGDKVKLRPDVLLRHSRSVPAHAGYTKEGFTWRAILDSLEGKIGTIERVFPDSGHVNVQFKGHLIGIDWKELVKARGGIKIVFLRQDAYEKNKAEFRPTVRSRVRAELMAKNGKKKIIYALPNGAYAVRK